MPMCMACDEQAMFVRAWLQDAAARNVVPEGVTAEDFEAYGVTVPDALARERKAPPASAFSCDSPE